jgi:hypothetical protein
VYLLIGVLLPNAALALVRYARRQNSPNLVRASAS